jgi:hypothetical protein
MNRSAHLSHIGSGTSAADVNLTQTTFGLSGRHNQRQGAGACRTNS